MAFNISFYKITDERIKVTKTLGTATTVSGTLRDGSSITDPAVEIQYSGVPSWNYAYISEFGRYYYVTDIQSVVNGLWQVSLHVDVLMSYADYIKQCTAIVARQENDYNIEIRDGSMPIQNSKVLGVRETTKSGYYYEFTDGDSTRTPMSYDKLYNVAVLGGDLYKK